MIVDPVQTDEDYQRIDTEADHAQNSENHKLHTFIRIFLSLKHVFHAHHIVKHERNRKADAVGDQIINVENTAQHRKDTQVDEKGGKSHDTKFQYLIDQFFHDVTFPTFPLMLR